MKCILFLMLLNAGSAFALEAYPGLNAQDGAAVFEEATTDDLSNNLFGSPSCGPCRDRRDLAGGTWTRSNGALTQGQTAPSNETTK